MNVFLDLSMGFNVVLLHRIVCKHFGVEANSVRDGQAEVKDEHVAKQVPRIQFDLSRIQNQMLFGFKLFQLVMILSFAA